MADRPEIGNIVKAYKGGEGLTIYVLRIGKKEAGEVLIKYSGIDHDWNNKIVKARLEQRDSGEDYIIEHEGGDYNTFVMRKSGWGDQTIHEVHIPDGPSEVKVQYDEMLSKEIIPQHFLTEYLEQNKK